MELNLEPVKVDLQIETPSLERGAFYSLCFITENDEAPRTLEVTRLQDLLDNGYVREDLAYNFCLGVFAQQGIESVYIRAKRSYETYKEAFSSDSNDDYYYLVIESKDSEVISDFNDFVVSIDDYKLQFYSSNEEPIEGRKLVHYFFDRGSDKNDFYLSKVMGEPDYIEESANPEEPEEEEEKPTNFRFRIKSGSMTPEQVGFEVLTDFESEPLELVLLDSDTGEYIETIDFSGGGKYETEYLEGFIDPIYPDEFEDNTHIFYSGLESPINTFEVRSKHSRVSIARYLSPTNPDSPNTPDDFDGSVEVLSYSTTTPNQITNVENSLLLLPSYIPKAFNNFDDSFSDSTHIGTDITGWDTSHVKSMRKTFSRCTNFNQDISRWDVGNVTDMDYMFRRCINFNQDISRWDVSNVTDMEHMFRGCINFNQDLSSWCVKNISSQPDRFDRDCLSWTLPRPQWGTCPAPVRLDPYDPNYQAIPRMSAIFIQEEESLSPVELQQQRLAYPEGAWIGSCGDSFPSRVNWLHKYLSKVDVRKRDATSKVPPLSTTTAEVMKRRATVGSGLTTQGIIIHEQVSLDWIKWALGRKVWKTLYNNERINATSGGLDLVVNDVKEVLNLAIEEGMLSEYRITEVLFDRHSNNLSLKFSCKLMETILFVDISGSLYY